jgi:hypothetical protein
VLGIDVNSATIAKPLSAALVRARGSRFFIRRVGPIITFNIVITNVKPDSVPSGDLVTTVNMGCAHSDDRDPDDAAHSEQAQDDAAHPEQEENVDALTAKSGYS